jgi:histidinol-phosphatase
LQSDWRARYDAARNAANAAARLALGYFDGSFEVEWKRDETPVTIADRETESYLRRTLLDAFPEDGFLGEESGDQPGSSGFRWIIDPIDGTRNFVRGIPVWGTLVGLEHRGELIAGIVEAPALHESWHALRGDGAYHSERRMRVSDVSELRAATMCYTNLSCFRAAGHHNLLADLAERVQVQRGYGDFWGHMLVAEGAADVMVDYGLHPWDMAALVPIVEEAGGRFTAWDGAINLERPDVVATNGRLHETTLQLLTPPGVH